MELLKFLTCIFALIVLAVTEENELPCPDIQEIDASIPGNLSSPFYGRKDYPSDLACRYQITAPEGYRIKITFLDVDIELSDSCELDFLAFIEDFAIEDIPDISMSGSPFKMLGTFCGSNIPRPILTSEGHNQIKTVFISNQMIEGRGFLLHYESSPFFDSVCDEGFKECQNRNCYSSDQKCNGVDDCGDGTDEENCGQRYEKFPDACGLQTIKPNTIDMQDYDRIFGGDEAVPNSWPWQVSLQNAQIEPNGHFCGGTLINAQWILTAAHCVTDYVQPGEIVIHLGAHDKLKKTQYEILRRSARIISYPDKEGERATKFTYPDDMSLIKLNAPVQFNDGIQPACLPFADQKLEPGTKCYITGWGETAGTGGESVLKQSMQIVQSKTDCTVNSFGAKFVVNEKYQICVRKEHGSACKGDSGGPLNCRVGNKFYNFGATSFMISPSLEPCTGSGARTIYNSAISKADWIREIVNKYS